MKAPFELDWMGGAAKMLEPLYDLMKTLILLCGTIHTDDTSVKVRDSELPVDTSGNESDAVQVSATLTDSSTNPPTITGCTPIL